MTICEPHPEGHQIGSVISVSSTGGRKQIKEARYDLLPSKALESVAELYGRGAKKYQDHNWRLGYDWSLSFAALQRHSWQFWAGEDNDPETQLPHMASVAFHALALIEFMTEHPEFDDRFKQAQQVANTEVYTYAGESANRWYVQDGLVLTGLLGSENRFRSAFTPKYLLETQLFELETMIFLDPSKFRDDWENASYITREDEDDD